MARVSALAFIPTGSAFAQAPPPADTIDPVIVRPDEDRFNPRADVERDVDLSLLQASPRVMPPNAETTMLTLTDVIVEGNPTAFSDNAIETMFQPLMAGRVSVADLFRAAQAIEDLYRDNGFVTSQVIVPAQRVEDGIFRIQVIEGFIDTVSVSGDIGPVEKAITKFGRRLSDDKPIADKAIERFANLVADMPGVSGQVVLRPAARANATGGSDIEYVAQRKKFDAFFSIDNRGSVLTGPWAFFAGASLNSSTRFAEQLQATIYSTVDFNEQVVGQVLYSQLIGPRGLRGGVSVSAGFSNPGGPIESLGFESDTFAVGLFTEYPLIRTTDLSVWLGLSADLVNSTTDRLAFFGEVPDDEGLVRAFQDKTRTISATMRWRARLGGQDEWARATSGAIEISQGVDVLEATPDTTIETINFRSRPFGKAEYTVLSGDAFFNQDIPGPLQFFTRIGGQWASDPLLAVSEFSVGGARYGRGFEPAQLTGDTGFGASVEMQADLTPQVTNAGILPTKLDLVAPYAFLDVGTVWNNGPDGDVVAALGLATTPEFESDTLVSAGLGVRTRILDKLSIDLEAAFPVMGEVRFDETSDVQFFLRVAVFR